MNKTILITGAIFGILGISLGAFAAHGLEKLVSEDAVSSFETGVRYQIYHAFFLLILGATTIIEEHKKRSVYLLILVGIIFFSGSIYGLATNELSAFNFKAIALVTPIGGLLLIIAWALLLFAIIKDKRNLTN